MKFPNIGIIKIQWTIVLSFRQETLPGPSFSSFSELSSYSSTFLYVPLHFVYVPLKFHLFVSLLPLVSSSCYHLAVEATSVDVWPSTRAASFHGFVARSIHLRRIRDPRLLFSWPKEPRVTNLSVIRVEVHGALKWKVWRSFCDHWRTSTFISSLNTGSIFLQCIIVK